MFTSTPREITRKIRLLASKVAPGETPLYVSVLPEPGALPNECFQNTEIKAQRDAGSVVYGWQLWEWPSVLIEAEFHAVWRSPDGRLIDITPKPGDEEMILFVTDKQRAYQGISVDNVRIALRDDLLVHHFILLSERIFETVNRGDLKDQFGRVSLPADEIEPLLYHQNLVSEMLKKGLRAQNDCICGSGKKYKRCHGKCQP